MSSLPPVATSELHLDRTALASSQRKANGIYYTPPRLALLLAGWVLARDPKRILEPAFGDGVFLRAAHEVLRESGVADPSRRLFGVEIDPQGAQRVRESGLELRATQLLQDDLLSLNAKRLGGAFDAILGNPPYIRHHLLSPKLARRGRISARRLGIELNGRSDAWAYFCAHLVTFLNPGGRLGLVLPGSVLHADYAAPLLDALAGHEGEVQLIRISERLFRGVQERTVLLLIDRSRPGGNRVIYRRIADLSGLKRALVRDAPRVRLSLKGADRGGAEPRLPWRLTRSETACFKEVCAHKGVSRLGALAKVRIGVVTGANGFFIRTESDVTALGSAVESVPIVSRGAWLRVVRWNGAAQAAMAAEPSRLVLFPGSERRLTVAARAELRAAEEQGINLRSHCERRALWQSITDIAVPELFLPYMGSEPRWLVINEAGATCSNAIHRVWLREETQVSVETVAAASWTTLYRLSAELAGRSYGGGVLKVEPGGAAELCLAAMSVPGLLNEIEQSFRAGGRHAAEKLADQRILCGRLGMTRREVMILRSAAARLEALRKR